MKCDLLHELNEGLLTPEEAQEMLDRFLDHPGEPGTADTQDVETFFGFSRLEWTAYGQGAQLSDIADWRKNGWPSRCKNCGGAIDVEKFGWFVVKSGGLITLRHVKCPFSCY